MCGKCYKEKKKKAGGCDKASLGAQRGYFRQTQLLSIHVNGKLGFH